MGFSIGGWVASDYGNVFARVGVPHSSRRCCVFFPPTTRAEATSRVIFKPSLPIKIGSIYSWNRI
jgi:hypothetical protein